MQELQSNEFKGSTKDYTGLFVTTVTDVYLAKAKLLDYIPLMVKKATGKKLRSVILATGISISAQLLRLNFILASLKQVSIIHTPTMQEMLNLDDYLQRQLEEMSSYSADVILTVHLAIIESNEAEAFHMLKKLATNLRSSWTVELITKNILASQISKKELDQLLDSYLI